MLYLFNISPHHPLQISISFIHGVIIQNLPLEAYTLRQRYRWQIPLLRKCESGLTITSVPFLLCIWDSQVYVLFTLGLRK